MKGPDGIVMEMWFLMSQVLELGVWVMGHERQMECDGKCGFL